LSLLLPGAAQRTRNAVHGDGVRHGDDVAPGDGDVVHDDVKPCRRNLERNADEKARNAKRHPKNQEEVDGAVVPFAGYDDVHAAVLSQGRPSPSESFLAQIPCPVRGPSLFLSRDHLSSSVPSLSSSPSRRLRALPSHPILLYPRHWAHGRGGTHSYPYQYPSTIHSALRRLHQPLHSKEQAQAISSAVHSSDHLSRCSHDGVPLRMKAKAHAQYRQH